MLYDVALKIEYTYPDIADASRHLVRLFPANLAGEQTAIAGTMRVDPEPQERIDRVDFFGNRCSELFFNQPHEAIAFHVKARVERLAQGPRLDMSPPIATLMQELTANNRVDAQSPHHFIGASIRVPIERATTEYAQTVIDPEASALQVAAAINRALNRDIQFDPEATTVETPLLDAFERRHGVCQDFTHIMIACLRGVGIPAGYVSGYLRTIPPEGQARLEGADAMHAWVRAWCGTEMGWIEFDPTNDMMAGEDHIAVARGRDYFDVAPVKGVLRSAGDQESKQSVDVVPVI